MLSLTRKTDYALIALAELARSGQRPVSARDLAERLGVSGRVLTNVLNRLTHHALVFSTRGVNGGYTLSKHPSEVTLASVIEAVEGPVYLARCCPSEDLVDDQGCRLEASCVIKEPMRRLNGRFKDFLEQVMLSELVSDTVLVSIGVAGAGDTRAG